MAGRHYQPMLDRFWAKVAKAGPGECWPWTAAINDDGYGWFRVSQDDGMALAHRVSWVIHFGPIPEGKQVLHTCDNPPCVNPGHFFLGDHDANMADMTAKGRAIGKAASPGDKNPAAKLTDKQVIEIREIYAAGGISQTALGARYGGIAQSQIGAIVRREAWRHI